MDALKELFDQKSVVVILALIVGLALGLLYAWVVNPVEWINGVPSQMRQDLQIDYLRMVIDSYSLNNDAELANQRYALLGEERSVILAEVGKDPGEVAPADIQRFKELIEIQPSGEALEAEGETEEPAAGINVSQLLLPVCGVTLFLGLLLAAALILRRRGEGVVEPIERDLEMGEADALTPDDARPADQPLATFRTTYSLGDDLYDDSFSIESPAGDFLGECGVGIGDMIGVGDPKKVSAFEVWLFDKNDIQTVTKVIMSRYAYDDEATRSRLSAKGDPIEVKSGNVVTLDTASLRVEARIVDMSYGEGALPAESFLERLTIELRAFPRGV